MQLGFAVNGSALPEVDFNIGESHAGTLPITPVASNPTDPNRLWFWFFRSSNPLARNEIVIWLNGGPGCSSLVGVLQEHGNSRKFRSKDSCLLFQDHFCGNLVLTSPFETLAAGRISQMIYIDQPVSTGFSTGNISVNDEHDVTTHFMGFWANFIDLFSMQGYDIYITGESYAGQYVPYIASGFLDAKDEINFNLKDILINDPGMDSGDTLQQGRFLFISSSYLG